MKTKIEKEINKFAPCSLTITFESQKELDAFGTLFNHASVSDAIISVFPGAEFSEQLYDKVVALGGDISKYNIEIGRVLFDKLKLHYGPDGIFL